MRNALVCWAPECGVLVAQPATGRPRLYCTPAHKMRARRRNGDKPPAEPYPPLEQTGTDVPPQVRGVNAEPAPIRPAKAKTPRPAPLQQDATAATVASEASPEPGDLKSSPEASPPPQEAPPAPARTPERAGATPDNLGGPAPANRNQAREGSGPADPESEAEPAPAPVTQLHVAITEDSTVPVEIRVHPMVAAYKADVAKLGKAGSRQGLQVIEMAEKLVSSATSPAAAANLSKELHRLMDALEESSNDALVSQDPSLIIRDRTLEKLRQIQAAGVTEASA